LFSVEASHSFSSIPSSINHRETHISSRRLTSSWSVSVVRVMNVRETEDFDGERAFTSVS
jgi:hypothetical protein